MGKTEPTQASRFLNALTDDSSNTFQTFDDTGNGRRALSRVLHGPFTRHMDALAQLNARGAGVFVMVNRGDGGGRRASNVVGCRALFVDLDGAPLEPVMRASIPPRIVVESSPGRWHAYWPIVDLPSDRFQDAQKALAARFGGDPKVHDLPRVMRLPGFWHRKAEPFLSRIVHCERAPLTWTEMAQAFDLSVRLVLPGVIPEGERNDALFRLALSAARKGVPYPAQLAKLRTVNAERCAPPLPDAEVEQIVTSAYRTPLEGDVRLPLALIDSDAYRGLSDGARTLVLLARRRADSFTDGFSLTHSELARWFSRRQTFDVYRTEIVGAGILRCVRKAVSPKRGGSRPKPALYQFNDMHEKRAYQTPTICTKTATPEALQVEAKRGRKRRRRLASEKSGQVGGRK